MLLLPKSSEDAPVDSYLPQKDCEELNLCSRQLSPSNSNDQLMSISSPVPLPGVVSNSSVHSYVKAQVPNAAFVPVEMNWLNSFAITCSMTTPRNATNAYSISSPMQTGTYFTDTGRVWGPINTDMHSMTSTSTCTTTRLAQPPTKIDKRKHAYLETNTSVVFTLEKPGDLQGFSNVQESEKPLSELEVQSGSSAECPSGMPIISLPQYKFHPYKVPLSKQRSSSVRDCPMEGRQEEKQEVGICSTNEQQADMLQQECHEATKQVTWRDLRHVRKWQGNQHLRQSNQQLLPSAFTPPIPNNPGVHPTQATPNLMGPVSSWQGPICVRDEAQSPRGTHVQTGLEDMQFYPARAAHNPEPHPTLTMHDYISKGPPNVTVHWLTEPAASKPFLQPHPLSTPALTKTWFLRQPMNDLGYSCIAHAQGKQEDQLLTPPFSWSCSQVPQIMYESSSLLPVTPCDVADNKTKLVTEESLFYPSNGYTGHLPYLHGLSVPMHQQLAPLIPPQAYPINCLFCPGPPIDRTGNHIPIQPKPSIIPQASHRKRSGSTQQYPDASDMFSTANLILEAAECKNAHAKVNSGIPIAPNIIEMIRQFPQRNVIPVKLKVQDDMPIEDAKAKRGDVGGVANNADMTNKAIGTAAISRNKVSKAQKTNQCVICKKFFSRRSAVKTHMRIHTGEKPYKCPFCSRTFLQASALETHKRCHTGEKPYSCDKCQNSFAHSTSLRTHMRTHTGERPFHCPWQGCGKAFADKSTLTKHRCVHTGEKPYKCSECGAKFTQIGNMNKHQARQHSDTVCRKKHKETENSCQDQNGNKTSGP